MWASSDSCSPRTRSPASTLRRFGARQRGNSRRCDERTEGNRTVDLDLGDRRALLMNAAMLIAIPKGKYDEIAAAGILAGALVFTMSIAGFLGKLLREQVGDSEPDASRSRGHRSRRRHLVVRFRQALVPRPQGSGHARRTACHREITFRAELTTNTEWVRSVALPHRDRTHQLLCRLTRGATRPG